MCLCPKHILHASNHWSPFEHSLFLTVPCGKCSECCTVARQGWFVRCYYEWLSHFNSTYFYTLTYDSDHLPRIYGKPCFSKSGVQKFFKRLRKFLWTHYQIKFRYMLTSEYGELRKRPHYHVLFFLSRPLPVFVFLVIVRDCWSQGIVKPGDNGGLVNSCAGVEYVVKYITKDDAYVADHEKYIRFRLLRSLYARFLDEQKEFDLRSSRCVGIDFPLFRKLLNFGVSTNTFDFYGDESLKSFWYDKVEEYRVEYRRQLAECLPFHLQSLRLGLSLLDDKTHVNLRDEVVTIVGRGDYPLPRYFRRKLWYDCVPNDAWTSNTRFVLNDAGREHMLDKFESSFKCDVITVESLLSRDDIDDDTLRVVNGVTSACFANVHDLRYFLNNVDISIPLLSVYRCLFHDRYCFESPNFNCDSREFVKHRRKYALRQIYRCSLLDFGSLLKDGLKRVDSSLKRYVLWNDTPLFAGCEFLSSVLDALYLDFRAKSVGVRDYKDASLSRTRQLFV